MKFTKLLLSAAACVVLLNSGCKKDEPTVDAPAAAETCSIESQKVNGVQSVKMEFDGAHRPVRYYIYSSTTGALNGDINFVYNSSGKLSQYTSKDAGGVVTNSTELLYNANGKLIQVKTLDAAGLPEYITNYEYDASQRMTRVESRSKQTPTSTVLVVTNYTTYNYGSDAKAISSAYTSVNSPSSNRAITYSYDANNNLTSEITVRPDNSRSVTQNVFDNKKGGYFILPGYFSQNIFGSNAPNNIAGKNNVITQTNVSYDNNNVETYRSVYNNTYEFDAKSNPTRKTSVPSSGTTAVYDMLYHCH